MDFIVADHEQVVGQPPGTLLDTTFPVTVEAKNLYVKVRGRKKEERAILNDISLNVPAGKLMAIMGSSGSGKTTLLNALAGRAKGITGQITFNGQNQEKFLKNGLVAYVEQHDNLLPYVSVRETLRYVARLRLPRDMPKSKKFEIVEAVILELGLKECADTLIGDDWHKGISGGERRRVSVGVQLLTNPSVIFLDEPTTGLDAFNARSLIETLLNLAHNLNRTIILSIHQPRSDIFGYFDQITLLGRGGLLTFCGTPHEGVEFFQGLGFRLGEGINGADYLVDAVAIDDRTEASEMETTNNLNRVVEAFRSTGQTTTTIPAEEVPYSGNRFTQPKSADFFEQVAIISRRILVNMWEDRLMQWGSFLNVVVLGIVLGAMNYKLDENLNSIFARKSIGFSINCVPAYCGLLFITYKLSSEMRVFDRERRDKMYSVPAYLVAWLSLHFALYAILAIIYSAIMYFMVGLRTDNLAYHFGILVVDTILVQWVTVASALLSLGHYAVSCWWIPDCSVPVYVRWMKYFSMPYYAYQIFAYNEFKDRQFACPSIPEGSPSRVLCDGNNVLASIGFDNPLHVSFLGFIALIVGTILVAGLVLHFLPATGVKQAEAVTQPDESKKKGADKKEKKDAGSEAIVDMDRTKTPSISVTLKDLTFALEPTKTSKFASLTKTQAHQTVILDSITASFPAGQLTAVLGASGAGKSTLLSLLQARPLSLPSHLKPKQSGSILHNGVPLEEHSVGGCTASVRQDDTHLLPALTARETLVYAALLRLPQSWSKQRKLHRADEVLVELGLKDCANTLVGGGDVKGLSGGEKRRLSVGLAMLMDPAILLLDEPTSGLDSAAARNMMITLQNIAAKGRTVVCTVHQPRSDIYPLFDRVLLLARGGRVVYEGPGVQLVPHLAEHGHCLPTLTNPADFALDVASVDLRNMLAENMSRERVSILIDAWKARSLNHSSDQEPDSELAGKISALSLMRELPFVEALLLLMSRSFLNLTRQPGLAISRVMNVFGGALIFMIFYVKIGTDQSGVNSRLNLLQQSLSMMNSGMITCISMFPQELLLFKFEYQDRAISTQSFFLAYTLIELPFELIASTLFAIFSRYITGLQLNPGYLILALIGVVSAGESIGIAFSVFFSKPGFSLQLLSLILTLMVLSSGLISVAMPVFLTNLNYLSVVRYAARTIAAAEFLPDMIIDCPVDTECAYHTGTDVMKLFGFPVGDNHLAFNMVGLVICVVLYRVIAFGVMKWLYR
ncbi:P-loop containing nucleoside triphosphate hydrolase protein [Obelidium mucronatum]|nr:P-loop containing nucleoside triphosphate hydrolase protein [Obelidium mucronatum]